MRVGSREQRARSSPIGSLLSDLGRLDGLGAAQRGLCDRLEGQANGGEARSAGEIAVAKNVRCRASRRRRGLGRTIKRTVERCERWFSSSVYGVGSAVSPVMSEIEFATAAGDER